ncbi:hypothetical protein M0802_009110 [Mischocyttarus mexicanus]|nr:hypothetical protein M0802_009110 [Mischocyttarus mexicanus]
MDEVVVNSFPSYTMNSDTTFGTIYNFLMECHDPRLKNSIFFNSPLLLVIVLSLYYYFIFSFGPRFMKNREPYSLINFIRYYNILQVVLNIYVVYKFIKGGWLRTISMTCESISYKFGEEEKEIIDAVWWTYLSKNLDLIETVIFVLRKKDRQISFLHLYHHVSTLSLAWLFARYFTSRITTFIPLVNCSIHVVMYTYYFLSSCEGNIRKAIKPYKSILTITQMVQFIILNLFIMQAFLPSCDLPKIPAIIVTINIWINFFLFYNFYRKNYSSKKTKQN